MTRDRHTERYGNSYWCVKVTEDVSPDLEIYVHADTIELRDGAAVFLGTFKPKPEETEPHVNLIIPAGRWRAVYAASVIDGAAVAVEHWTGEVTEL